MNISFTAISPTHHRFEYERSDGTGESVELETKSVLLHDFVHLSLEESAHLKHGFFGLLQQGYSLSEVAQLDKDNPITQETLDVERIVGPLSGFLESNNEPAECMHVIQTIFDSYNEPVPDWFSIEVIKKCQAYYRDIKGKWNALAFGESLVVTFGDDT